MTSIIEEDDLSNIRATLNNLPYSGTVAVPQAHRSVNDVDSLIAWLNAFSEHLKTVADEHQELEQKYANLSREHTTMTTAARGLLDGWMALTLASKSMKPLFGMPTAAPEDRESVQPEG